MQFVLEARFEQDRMMGYDIFVSRICRAGVLERCVLGMFKIFDVGKIVDALRFFFHHGY